MLFVSVIAAIVLVLGLGYAAPYLPFNELLGGSFYQVVAILLAIAISIVLNLPMLYMYRGNSSYKKGKYKEAVEFFKKAYKTNKLSPDMEIYCGYIFLKEGDKTAATEVMEKVSKRKLNDYQKNTFDMNMALLMWKKGQLDEAIALLKNVRERAETATVTGSLGALMLIRARDTGDYAEALEFCEKANEQYTYDKTIMANLGEAYYETGQNDKALQIFAELMDCGTTAPAPFYYYGMALLRSGEKEDAKAMIARALRQRFTALATVSKKTVKAQFDLLGEE